MSKIGYLKPTVSIAGEKLQGEIRTLQMQLRITLEEETQKMSQNAPDFKILAVVDDGDIQIGSAWRKQATGSQHEFLSLTIDDPSLPQPLNVAAFRQDDGAYDITWRRRQAAKPAA